MITLPLNEMTVEEKLQAMEMLWADLSRRSEDVPSPDWHGAVLLEREAALARGEEEVEDWESAKRRIRTELL
jgi:hypothetical protein